MEKFLQTLIIALIIGNAQSQTLVKMGLPQQPEAKLQVVKLFDESLPLETTVVLGAIGFNISGGTEPYSLNWLKDEKVFASGDIAVFKPEAGKNYSLQVVDKKQCKTTVAINIDATPKIGSPAEVNLYQKNIQISPTRVTHSINISFAHDFNAMGKVRIFDMQGKLNLSTVIYGSTTIPVQLPAGNYVVLVESTDDYATSQIIVQP